MENGDGQTPPPFFCSTPIVFCDLLLGLENLPDRVIRAFEVKTRLAVRSARYRSPDLAAQRYELAPQLVSGVLEQRRWRRESGEVDDRCRRRWWRIQLQIHLRQKLVLQCSPIRINSDARTGELGPDSTSEIVQHRCQ